MQGGVIGLVGHQGVGKSVALQALYTPRIKVREEKRRKLAESKAEPEDTDPSVDVILFKWRREHELFRSLMDETHELSHSFHVLYREVIWNRIQYDPLIAHREKSQQHDPGALDLRWAQKRLGRSVIDASRREAWRGILVSSNLILIDMPDYSKIGGCSPKTWRRSIGSGRCW